MTPTQRTLKVLRERGYVADVVERWLPHVKVRKDLFGLFDVLAVGADVVGVQCTSGSNVSARVEKITGHENVAAVRKAGIRVLVHGWRKNAKGRYVLREVDLS